MKELLANRLNMKIQSINELRAEYDAMLQRVRALETEITQTMGAIQELTALLNETLDNPKDLAE